LSAGRFAESRHTSTATPDNAPTAAMSIHDPFGSRHSPAANATTAVIAAVNPIWTAVKIMNRAPLVGRSRRR